MLDAYNNQAEMLDAFNIAQGAALLDGPNTVPDAAPSATPVDPPVYTALMRIKPSGLTKGGWATKAGLARNVFNYIQQHGNPKRETLQKLLGAIGWTLERFEAEARPGTVLSEVRGADAVGIMEVDELFYGPQPLPLLPVYGSAIGGELGDGEEHIQLIELDTSEVLDFLRRPAGLASDRDAYALIIQGDSMYPRFKPGERVAVSPNSEPQIGDDVIVQLRAEGDDRVRMVLIKELVRRTATYVELRQYNPLNVFRISRRKIVAMHQVRGHFL
jgi:hypothetical protein